jgi:hypothetical protein
MATFPFDDPSHPLSDVTLLLDDGTRFYCNRFALAKDSGFFVAMFTNGMNETANARGGELCIPEVPSDAMRLYLSVVYGQKKIEDLFVDKLADFMRLAIRFAHEPYIATCISRISGAFASPDLLLLLRECDGDAYKYALVSFVRSLSKDAFLSIEWPPELLFEYVAEAKDEKYGPFARVPINAPKSASPSAHVPPERTFSMDSLLNIIGSVDIKGSSTAVLVYLLEEMWNTTKNPETKLRCLETKSKVIEVDPVRKGPPTDELRVGASHFLGGPLITVPSPSTTLSDAYNRAIARHAGLHDPFLSRKK